MKIRSNKISDMCEFYRITLTGLYEVSEVDELIFIAFEHVLKYTREQFLLSKNDNLNQSDLIEIYDIAKALATGKPIQQILQKAWFYKDEYFVNEHVLIPRPETEELVELIKNENTSQQITLLDIGTGSGCIPLALKKLKPSWEIHALDVSVKALEVASINAQRLNRKIHFHHHDILSDEFNPNQKFDIIVSNPPYITKSESPSLQKQVIEFEPHLALFVENDNPFLFYDKITEFAKQHLNPNGKLYFEINQKYGPAIQTLLIENNFGEVRILKDINQNERMVSGVLDR
jgi:release factor glutamine methyltransferase